MVSSNMTYIPTQNTQTFQLKIKLTAQAEEKENLIDETLPIARNTLLLFVRRISWFNALTQHSLRNQTVMIPLVSFMIQP